MERTLPEQVKSSRDVDHRTDLWSAASVLYAMLAGRAPSAVVNSCGSGVSACMNLLAMAYAGLPGGALYGGSWSEWVADRSRPVATGPNP